MLSEGGKEIFLGGVHRSSSSYRKALFERNFPRENTSKENKGLPLGEKTYPKRPDATERAGTQHCSCSEKKKTTRP